jgi:hypothetical protein
MEQRKALEPAISRLVEAIQKEGMAHATTDVGLRVDGIVNYVITRLLLGIFFDHAPRYTDIERAVSTLECAKLELYRRVAAPYENIKAKQNGDVYPWQKDAQLHREIEADPRLMPKGSGPGQ